MAFIMNISFFQIYQSKAQHYTEYEVKAAYIYNFIKFVEWPSTSFENEYSPFIIAVYGDNPFGSIIQDAFNERTLYNRKWILKTINSVEEISGSHLLFISDTNIPELNKILAEANKHPILTVGDNIEGFCFKGGIINFSSKNSKYKFEINNTNAIKTKLVISSKLLSLSKLIKEDEDRF
jgi:hypothetical protein